MAKFLKTSLKVIFALGFVLFILLNVITYNHAYNFTHFGKEDIKVPRSIEEITFKQKVSYLFWGFETPRPKNDTPIPDFYENVLIASGSGSILECWHRKHAKPKPTVILYHGYTNVKSFFLKEAKAFFEMGYDVLLVDFQGHGGSTGNFTSIGYFESYDVLATYNYISRLTKEPIFLYGHSMGSVAILKAVSEYKITPDALILECPYGSMMDAVRSRIEMMNLPSWGLAEILTFWGSVQNNYWAFGMDCEKYAKDITMPSLLYHGKLDQRVSMQETTTIFEALGGPKKRFEFEEAGHQPYYKIYPKTWGVITTKFLKRQ